MADLIWERLAWTVAVSGASLLFSWVVALPIGIYSAVHKYSALDYLLTFVGFIGLSIPNFFVALVLMYLLVQAGATSVGGLFSPELIGTPWNWTRFVDFLNHLWVPVIAIGTSGTAGLLRLMRGNLLVDVLLVWVDPTIRYDRPVAGSGKEAKATAVAEIPAEAPDSQGPKNPLTRGQLVRRRFLRHRVGVAGLAVLGVLYGMILLGPFFAPYPFDRMDRDHLHAPPTPIHFVDAEGRFHPRPFVYGIQRGWDPVTFQFRYEEDRSEVYPIRFFVPGEPYRLLGIIPARVRLFGLDPGSDGRLFLFGTDRFGRDLWGRILLGGQVTLSVGVLGILLSRSIGVVMGGISGYYGGRLDNLIQRLIELLRSFPTIPLWLALSMILPPEWPSSSFLGLGTKEPMTSWGLLLRDAQTLQALRLYPWLRIPGIFIVVAVLAFNFVGDAVRDAFDPYAEDGP